MDQKQPVNSLKSASANSNDILHRLAFNKSFQPTIIIEVSSGKILLINMAACKLLGYARKEILTKNRSSIFQMNDAGFKKMLQERSTEGHSIAAVNLIRKSGTLIACEINSTIFIDEGIEKSITSITDLRKSILKQKKLDIKKDKLVSDNIVTARAHQKVIDIEKENAVSADIVIALKKSDERLAENNAWIKYIAKASYDVMWDLDIATGKLYVGDSIEEVFGYKVRDNIMDFNDYLGHIVHFERARVESKLMTTLASASKIWNDAFLFKRFDGSVSSTVSRASIVRDGNGRGIRLIGAMQDVSKVQDLEKQLKLGKDTIKEHNDVFQLAAKLSYDGIWDWNLITNEFYLGEGFGDLFGHAIEASTSNIDDWSKHLHPDDKVAVVTGLREAIASSAARWEHTYRFIRADGSVAEVFGRANIIRDKNGRASRLIGAVHDISKQGMLEKKLKQEIELKEIQKAKATEEAKDTERSDISKELHDNVNQLLVASKMYLDMAKGGSSNSAMYMGRSSEYTILAIEEIRKLTKGLKSDLIKDLGLCPAIEAIIHDMTEVNPIAISFTPGNFTENADTVKFRLTLYRIIQEQLNNIIKYAQASTVSISLAQEENSVLLVISDNGVGFDTTKKQKGIGIENIKSRALSHKGEASFVSQPGHGCILSVRFPLGSPG